MRKFTITSVKDKNTIMEVECQKVLAMEDSSVLWLPANEHKFRILAPKSFVEKDGKPLVWMWFMFHDSLEAAKVAYEKVTREAFEFNLRKYDTAYTEEDVQAALAAVEVVML